MRRRARRLFAFCSAVSLLLSVAACVLWVRSFRVSDFGLRQFVHDEGDMPYLTEDIFHLSRGGVAFVRKDFAQPREARRRELGLKSVLKLRPPSPRLYVGRPPTPIGFDHRPRPGSAVWWFSVERYRREWPDTRMVVRESRWVLPLWPLAVAFGAPPIIWLRYHWRLGYRAGPGLCPSCGYDLRSSPQRCPECGAERITEGAIA